jgi:hypothetical protein
MPFTICILFELFRQWYDMTAWQFNLILLQQVIKYSITLSNVKCVAHLVLSAFRNRLQARAYEWFSFRTPTPFSYAYVDLFIVR